MVESKKVEPRSMEDGSLSIATSSFRSSSAVKTKWMEMKA